MEVPVRVDLPSGRTLITSWEVVEIPGGGYNTFGDGAIGSVSEEELDQLLGEGLEVAGKKYSLVV